jgi:hypothetical protein
MRLRRACAVFCVAVMAAFVGMPMSARALTSPAIDLGARAASVCANVVTAQQLVNALASGCRDIRVSDRARFDLSQLAAHPDQYPGYRPRTNHDLAVIDLPEGVTLESDRGPNRAGGMLYMSSQVLVPTGDVPLAMTGLGPHTRLSELRLRGFGLDGQHDPGGIGIVISAQDVRIDHNEISFWPNEGVLVASGPSTDHRAITDAAAIAQAQRVRITQNFIHDNVDCDLGYGIVLDGASYALIDRNVFNYDKHDISGDGSPGSGYVAEYNFTQSDSFKTCDGDYGGHFDMHGFVSGSHVGGTAGTYIDVHDNAVRGDQRYHFAGRDRRPAFDLRGTPVNRALFTDNVTEAPSDKALRISGASVLDLVLRGKLIIHGNQYGVNTTNDLAVGDFDGDGCSDVFVPTGAVWLYAPCGRREWQFLGISNLRLGQLAFGDFNGDGKTDVFTRRGDQWLTSSGGTTSFEPLPETSGIPMSSYRFGDFNGDGKTDVFRANGSRFYYSNGGATPWRPLASSHLAVGDLRFCDFNGDGVTDVFSLANHQWSVSYGGDTSWRHLNSELSPLLNQLAFGDLDGDGHCDIARSQNARWQVSSGGTGPWRDQSPNPDPGQLVGTLLGHFNGQRCDDVLRFGVRADTVHLERWQISRCPTPFVGWCEQNML